MKYRERKNKYRGLPYGSISRIAKECGVSHTLVSLVLGNKAIDYHGIRTVADRMLEEEDRRQRNKHRRVNRKVYQELPRGTQSRIAEEKKISKSTVSCILGGIIPDYYGVEDMADELLEKERQRKRMNLGQDRWDILNNLPVGGLKQLADNHRVSPAYINLILGGKRRDHRGIITEAELMAAKNIWRTRFCKVAESTI